MRTSRLRNVIDEDTRMGVLVLFTEAFYFFAER